VEAVRRAADFLAPEIGAADGADLNLPGGTGSFPRTIITNKAILLFHRKFNL
jgi:hypothetical protein